jgi:hypothetical protein
LNLTGPQHLLKPFPKCLEFHLRERVDRSSWWYFAIPEVGLAVLGMVFQKGIGGLLHEDTEVLPELIWYQLQGIFVFDG